MIILLIMLGLHAINNTIHTDLSHITRLYNSLMGGGGGGS